MSLVHRLMKEWEETQGRNQINEPAKKKVKKKKIRKKAWDSTTNDLGKYKLSQEEQLKKKSQIQSKHRNGARELVRQSRQKQTAKRRELKKKKKQSMISKWDTRVKKTKPSKKKRKKKNDSSEACELEKEDSKKSNEDSNNSLKEIIDPSTNRRAVPTSNASISTRQNPTLSRFSNTSISPSARYDWTTPRIPCGTPRFQNLYREDTTPTDSSHSMNVLDSQLNALQTDFQDFQKEMMQTLSGPKDADDSPIQSPEDVNKHEIIKLEQIVTLISTQIHSMQSQIDILTEQVSELQMEIKQSQHQGTKQPINSYILQEGTKNTTKFHDLKGVKFNKLPIHNFSIENNPNLIENIEDVSKSSYIQSEGLSRNDSLIERKFLFNLNDSKRINGNSKLGHNI